MKLQDLLESKFIWNNVTLKALKLLLGHEEKIKIRLTLIDGKSVEGFFGTPNLRVPYNFELYSNNYTEIDHQVNTSDVTKVELIGSNIRKYIVERLLTLVKKQDFVGAPIRNALIPIAKELGIFSGDVKTAIEYYANQDMFD